MKLGDAVPPPSTGVVLEARFPPRGSGPMTTGRVLVRAVESVSGLTTPEAFAVLARDGRVVSEPVPSDLVGVRLEVAAGAEIELPAAVGLSGVSPGEYQLHAGLVLTDDHGEPRQFVSPAVVFTVT
jgi:hypothetical protein